MTHAADFDVAIVGGGVVGLAIAEATSRNTDSMVLFERNPDYGSETSSRNSEVIHAGIYYKPGSLKAKLCVKGVSILYRIMAENNIPHEKCGKIIVATSEEEEAELGRLADTAIANGVEGIELLTSDQVKELEPDVFSVAGLLSPQSGILNAHSLMDYFAKTAESRGADIVCGAAVTQLSQDGDIWRIGYEDSEDKESVTARVVVNAAGLGAEAVMEMAGIDAAELGLKVHLCKGEYFAVHGENRRKIGRLIYPVPRENLMSLGIHTVTQLGGGFKLGPSAFYVDEIDYTVDANNLSSFHEDVQHYLPFLKKEDLAPDMSGIRPKLSGPGEPAHDFHIAMDKPGFVNLVGIDSPGLTAAPAIGEMVAEMIAKECG